MPDHSDVPEITPGHRLPLVVAMAYKCLSTFIALAWMCVLSVPALASTTFTIDNDLFSGSGRDRDYTGGLRLTYQTKKETSWQSGVLLFTPDNFDRPSLTDGERPYANLLYVARSRETRYTAAVTRQTIAGGIVGLPFANTLQRAIHRATGSDKPSGYKHQISDGGEPTLRLGWTRYTPLRADSGRFTNFTVVAETSASLGYYTGASLGLGFNLRRQAHYWGNTIYHFQPQLDEPTDHSSLGLFGGVRLRAVGYNVLLQGQFRNSPSRLRAGQVRRVVTEAWLGFAATYKGYRFSYALRANSPEYKNGAAHFWGALSVSKQLGSL